MGTCWITCRVQTTLCCFIVILARWACTCTIDRCAVWRACCLHVIVRNTTTTSLISTYSSPFFTTWSRFIVFKSTVKLSVSSSAYPACGVLGQSLFRRSSVDTRNYLSARSLSQSSVWPSALCCWRQSGIDVQHELIFWTTLKGDVVKCKHLTLTSTFQLWLLPLYDKS